MWIQGELGSSSNTPGFGSDGEQRTPPWAAWVSVGVATTHRYYSVTNAAFAGPAARAGLVRDLRRVVHRMFLKFRRRHYRYPTDAESRALSQMRLDL